MMSDDPKQKGGQDRSRINTTSPPIMRASLRDSARPSPVPP
jgi:hypothetical protein